MKSCDDIDALLTPYVDREADSAVREAVEDHLAHCGPCRTRAATEEAARRLVQSRASTLTASAPASLRARCVGAVPASDTTPHPVSGGAGVRRWLPLSMAATLLLAVGGVFIAGQQERLEAAFAAQLAIDHEKCFTEFGPGHPPLDAEAAEEHLATVHGVDVLVPVGDDQVQVVLVDARSCEYEGGRMTHLLYEVEGRQVSLFVVPNGSHAEGSIDVVGHQARLWSTDDVGYVLVGDVDGAEGAAVMDKVAAYMQAYEG